MECGGGSCEGWKGVDSGGSEYTGKLIETEPSDYFSQVTISSANLDRSGKRVQFEMKMLRKGQ